MTKNVIAEASELGWAPGYWPTRFVHETRTFLRTEFHRDQEGDVTYVDYFAQDLEGRSYRLRVFND